MSKTTVTLQTRSSAKTSDQPSKPPPPPRRTTLSLPVVPLVGRNLRGRAFDQRREELQAAPSPAPAGGTAEVEEAIRADLEERRRVYTFPGSREEFIRGNLELHVFEETKLEEIRHSKTRTTRKNRDRGAPARRIKKIDLRKVKRTSLTAVFESFPPSSVFHPGQWKSPDSGGRSLHWESSTGQFRKRAPLGSERALVTPSPGAREFYTPPKSEHKECPCEAAPGSGEEAQQLHFPPQEDAAELHFPLQEDAAEDAAEAEDVEASSHRTKEEQL